MHAVQHPGHRNSASTYRISIGYFMHEDIHHFPPTSAEKPMPKALRLNTVSRLPSPSACILTLQEDLTHVGRIM